MTGSSKRHPVLRRLAAGVLIAIAGPVSLVLGAAAFFGSAILIDVVAVVAVIALLVCGAVGYMMLAAAAGLLGVTRPRRAAAIVSVTGATIVAGLVAASAFVPIDYGFEPAPPSAAVEYWQLDSGSRVAYTHAEPVGERRAKAVVFLHGGPGTPGEGMPPGTAELTAAGFDVYAYDQVGAGRSSRLEDVNEYTVARQVGDLELIRQQIDVESMILVGRSWGASLAAQYIAKYPDRVERVVFVSPGELWPAAFDAPVSNPWATLPAQAREQFDELFSTPRVVLLSLLEGFNPNTAHSFVGDDEADALLHTGAVIGQNAGMCEGSTAADPHSNSQGFYVNQVTSDDFASVADPRPVLRERHVPVLVIRGDCDFVTPLVAEEYQSVFEGARLVAIAGAGHAVWSQAPPEYLAALLSFIVDGS